MDKQLGQEYPQGQAIEQYLRDNADKVEKKDYMRQFTPEELMQMKDELSTTAIEINNIEESKKEAVAEFKRQLDPLNEEKKRLLTGIKNKAESVNEEVFKFVNPTTKEVGFYNKDGHLIESRPAYVDELQGNIFQMRAAQ